MGFILTAMPYIYIGPHLFEIFLFVSLCRLLSMSLHYRAVLGSCIMKLQDTISKSYNINEIKEIMLLDVSRIVDEAIQGGN